MIKILIPTMKERRGRLEQCLASIKEHVKIPHKVMTFENNLGGFVPAIHEMLKHVSGPVFCIGDDTLFIDDSLDRLFAKYQELYPEGDGLVQPDDGILHGSVATMPLCDARTIQKYTYKGYNHWYADEEFTEIMKAKGKYTYVPECKFEHVHWVNKKVEYDPTYAFSMLKNEQDRELFIKRKANNWQPQNDIA